MITVPTALAAEIEKLRGRKLTARCRLDFSDNTIDNTVIAFGSSCIDERLLSQVYNGKEDVSYKVFSLDGSCTLDGSYKLAPETEIGRQKYEVGWWSGELSVSEGYFPQSEPFGFGEIGLGDLGFDWGTSRPELYVNFTERKVIQIRISFDNAREEYAEDFDIVFLDIDSNVLGTKAITGNAGYKYAADIDDINSVAMIKIVLKKWSSEHKNAKICELYTSISVLVESNDIFSLNVKEERELADNGLPLGAVSSGSVTLVFFNRDRLYDWDNSDSKLYNFIRKGIKIIPEIGDGINWIPLGTFFAEEWDVPKDDITVTVEGLDRMAQLGDSTFAKSEAIYAPSDVTYVTDTQAEWGQGSMNGIAVSGNAIRLVFA